MQPIAPMTIGNLRADGAPSPFDGFNPPLSAALCSKFTRFGAQFIELGLIPEVTYATGIRIMFIRWLTANFSIMGVHIQYWIPTFILVFVVFYIFSEMDLRRIGK